MKNNSAQTILLDTDYAINFLRGIPETKKFILPLWKNQLAFLSILSVYELFAGMRIGEEEATNNFINACRIKPITLEIAKSAGQYRYKYQQKGVTLSVVDCLIAETARMNSHLIATNNRKHYPESEICSVN